MAILSSIGFCAKNADFLEYLLSWRFILIQICDHELRLLCIKLPHISRESLLLISFSWVMIFLLCFQACNKCYCKRLGMIAAKLCTAQLQGWNNQGVPLAVVLSAGSCRTCLGFLWGKSQPLTTLRPPGVLGWKGILSLWSHLLGFSLPKHNLCLWFVSELVCDGPVNLDVFLIYR